MSDHKAAGYHTYHQNAICCPKAEWWVGQYWAPGQEDVLQHGRNCQEIRKNSLLDYHQKYKLLFSIHLPFLFVLQENLSWHLSWVNKFCQGGSSLESTFPLLPFPSPLQLQLSSFRFIFWDLTSSSTFLPSSSVPMSPGLVLPGSTFRGERFKNSSFICLLKLKVLMHCKFKTKFCEH